MEHISKLIFLLNRIYQQKLIPPLNVSKTIPTVSFDPLNKQTDLYKLPRNCCCYNAIVTSCPLSLNQLTHVNVRLITSELAPSPRFTHFQDLGNIPQVGTQLTSLFLLYAQEALGGPDTPHFITAFLTVSVMLSIAYICV